MKPFPSADLETAADALEAFECDLRLHDIDGARVIFFTRPLEYFHEAMERYLASRGYPIAEIINAGNWALPVRHAEADYLAPLRLGDRVRVELVRVEMDETEIAFGYRLLRLPEGRVAVVGQTIHVSVDQANFRRRPFPNEIREFGVRPRL